MAFYVKWDPESPQAIKTAEGPDLWLSPERDMLLMAPELLREAARYIVNHAATDPALVAMGVEACPQFDKQLAEVLSAVSTYMRLTTDKDRFIPERETWEKSGLCKCDKRALGAYGYALTVVFLRTGHKSAQQAEAATGGYAPWHGEVLGALVRSGYRGGFFERLGRWLDRRLPWR
jgi:hypothetical protein